MSNVDCERRSPAFGLLVSNAATLKEAFIDPITTQFGNVECRIGKVHYGNLKKQVYEIC